MRQHWRITVILLLLIGGCIAIATQTGSLGALAFCTAATGIISFFYFATVRTEDSNDGKEARLRRAIASAIVLQYLLMVGIANYLINSKAEANALTQSLLSNFTTIVGVVIASYFGASAFVETRNKSDDKKDPK